MALSKNIVASIKGGGVVTAFPTRAFELTPDDDVTFVNAAVAVRAGSDGIVVVEPWEGGNTVPFPVSEGEFVPVSVKRVLATGTTATGLIGVY